ncbi:MAG: hypothetical protein VB980_02895, partial [Opitutales bacterium]
MQRLAAIFSEKRLGNAYTLSTTQPPNDPMSEFFPNVSKIQYEGVDSKNPLAFKHYDADELVEGKTMRDHLRFGAAYW